jgi:hypothetical protein
MGGRVSRGSLSSRNAWGSNSFSSRDSLPSRNSFSRGQSHGPAARSWNSASRFSGNSSASNRNRSNFGRAGSFDSNRPPFAQSRASSQSPQSFRGNSIQPGRGSFGRGSFGRGSSSNFARSTNAPGFGSNRPAASFTRGTSNSGNFARHASFASNGANRPGANRSSLGNLGGRGTGSWSNGSTFRSNRTAGGGFRNASFTRSSTTSSFGSGRFGGSRNFDFGGNRLGRSGYGYGRYGGHGYGYNHFGYGRFGYGHFGYGGFGWHGGYGWHGGWWDDPFADLWFLGDLFGLALDIGRFAIMPAWQIVGADLIGTGVQALASLGNDDNSYGGYDDNSYGYYNNESYPSYNVGIYVDQPYYATRADFVTAPCGNYYSDENPGCLQRFQ